MLKNFLNRILRIFNLEEGIFFVGSADKLPEPLSREDELYYVDLASNGDELARSKLIEHNLRLVVFLSKKYENTGVDLEDLVSIGTIGLIKGINTYTSRCIDNEILMFLRKNKKRKGEVSFEDSLSYDAEGNELHLEDILGTAANVVTQGIEDANDRRELYREIEKLNERDKQIMILRYGLFGTEEKTQKEVASMLGISQSYISRIEKKVIKRLKVISKI